MIKLHVDDKKEIYKLAGTGEMDDICAEFGWAIAKLYFHLKDGDEDAAEAFKRNMISLVGSEDGGVWRYPGDKN